MIAAEWAISIHAPRTGSDPANVARRRARNYFNPRSPHGERRIIARVVQLVNAFNFNPRSPHGERLAGSIVTVVLAPFQSTLPARGATIYTHDDGTIVVISIHAPRTGSDGRRRQKVVGRADFNPRSPHGERLAFCDFSPAQARFQSTLPARGATGAIPALSSKPPFQSTLPARGATAIKKPDMIRRKISIHAPRTGSDRTPPKARPR